MSAQYVNTLRYWFDVEALIYPDIPKPGKRPSFLGRYAENLPWLRPLTTQPTPAQDEHKYFTYFGLVEKKVLESELLDMFRVVPDSDTFSGNHVRASSGNTFLCAIEIAADGQPVISSLQLAAFSVAFAERMNNRKIGYASMLAALLERVQDLTSKSPAGIADTDWFEQVTGFLTDELGWQPRQLLARAQLCVHKVSLLDLKGKKLSREPEMELINSFYLDDLERILVDAETGTGSNQIQQYLDGHERASARLDVTKLGAVNAALEARRFPVGRWPTKFPLFLMQQVAVNKGLETLANGGIFSVNGPPGTGKTTLLMDVVAARLVERAKILAQFEHPEQAFSRTPTPVEYPANAAGTAMKGPCFFVDERLLDCGIVVASANNKAVENITLDLPSLEKVFPQPLVSGEVPFDYFAATAESILDEEKDEQGKKGGIESNHAGQGSEEELSGGEHAKPRCWGLVSVPLGNKKNRNLVVNRLGRFGKFGLIRELEKIPVAELDWATARAKFNAAVARVEEIQVAISRYDEIVLALADAHGRLSVSRAVEALAGRRNQLAKTALKSIDGLIEENVGALTFNLKERELQTLAWPWWRQILERLFRPSNFEQFKEQQHELSNEYDKLQEVRSPLQQSRVQASTKAGMTCAGLRTAKTSLATCEKEVKHLERVRLSLREALGTAAFDPAAFEKLSVEEQQKSLPRSNASYHAARADVFVAAMHLHKAFLKNAGKAFETNFRLALAMLGQEVYIQPHLPKMAQHLWATFFLAVPVVSSTFASISRCFCDLGEGQIGLLLVDEAGQAVPSHALGAIWRSKRALIVGDPLQVEPVIKMDQKLDFGMLTYHGAPKEHMLTEYSAQHLADRGNRFGANVVQHDGSDLWVGAPLRVHRRCADPMFSLSNDIAYNSKMVFGPPRADEKMATIARPLLGVSQWHDVSSGAAASGAAASGAAASGAAASGAAASGNALSCAASPADFDEHFSHAEGGAAVDIVVTYAKNGWVDKVDGLPEIFLISPFKSVAHGLNNALRDCLDEWAKEVDEEIVAKWLKGHVGTVHTFQGKECESVVFVLGGKTPGARSWAGNRPNLINVAVTRAKRRLYVIGNRQGWSQTVFGKKLAESVPALLTLVKK